MSTPHIALVGLPGAGKTTVGQLAATILGVPFHDLDAELVARSGLSIADQFARHGEPAFRAAEAALSRELDAAPPAILAPGGGWMTNPAARAALAATRTVYLHASPPIAAARLARDPVVRPLVAAATDPAAALTILLARRHPVYATADAMLDTDGRSAEHVAAALVHLVQNWTPRVAPAATPPVGAAA